MAKFLHSVLAQDESQSADGTVTYDLPINPLSFILLTIKGLNVTTTLGDFSVVQALLNMVTKIEVLRLGTGILSLSASDLYALDRFVIGFNPVQINTDDLDNEVRSVTLLIPLGRVPYSPVECFPATRKGELQLQVTTDVAVTGADGLILQAETVELIGASPERFLKVTTGTKTPTAVQEEDTELPIGNLLAGVLLYGTTITIGTTWGGTVFPADFVKLFVDNQEFGYSKSNWESLAGLKGLKGGIPMWDNHKHTYDPTGTTADVDTALGNDFSQVDDNYLLLDLDPLRDGSYVLDTAGKSRVNLRISHGNTSAMRVLPLELVSPSRIGL